MSDSLPQQWLEYAGRDLAVARLTLQEQFNGHADSYYGPTRYPDAAPGIVSSVSPSKDETIEAIDSAERILQFVTGKLKAS